MKPGSAFLGLVHRLDRPVSGVMLFARTSKAARRLHSEFGGRRVVKRYIALVETAGPLLQGEWIECEDRLARGRGFSRRADEGSPNAKTARLRYKVMANSDGYALLLVDLKTGRKHQIRAQLGALGMPVAGDTLYGSSSRREDGAICLHAAYMRFMHPTKGENIEIFSPIPSRFTEGLTINDALMDRILGTLASPASQ